MRHVTGLITMVQEQRFRLIADDGQGFLLTVGHGAPFEIDDLNRWHTSGVRVEVEYTGEPNVITGIAHGAHLASRRS